MNYRQIELFLLLADTHSFSKAEEAAFLTKQALKKQIDSLESELGLELFIRSNQGLKLTEAGKRFYDGMSKMNHDLDALIDTCKNSTGQKSILRIGVGDNPEILNLNSINKALEHCPDYKLDIQQLSCSPRDAKQLIKSGQLDIAEVTGTDTYGLIYRKDSVMVSRFLSYIYSCHLQ